MAERGHHSSIIPDRNRPVHFSTIGFKAIGAMALFEGGVNFVTREGEIILNEQWKSAESNFLRLLYEFDLFSERRALPSCDKYEMRALMSKYGGRPFGRTPPHL